MQHFLLHHNAVVRLLHKVSRNEALESESTTNSAKTRNTARSHTFSNVMYLSGSFADVMIYRAGPAPAVAAVVLAPVAVVDVDIVSVCLLIIHFIGPRRYAHRGYS